MARLKEFRRYLKGRQSVLEHAEEALCSLQTKYESFFAEVSKAREAELEQVIEHTLRDRSSLPEWFNDEVDATEAEVVEDFEKRLADLEMQRQSAMGRAEVARKASFEGEQEVRRTNGALDRAEEKLKERNRRLLDGIGQYNQKIAELGRGFGFFANLFKMRGLAKQKRALDQEQADVAANIEALRSRWVSEEAEHAAQEQQQRSQWISAENRAASIGAKIEALRQTRSTMVVRSTIERVLSQHGRESRDAESGSLCPRCGVQNPEANHFCHICAHRLGDDLLDFDGSLEEVAEINAHFDRFSEGMTACQQIIGLARGLIGGLEAFTKSVADVEESEEKYPLPKLEIDVPAASREFGVEFDRLKSMTDQDHSLHPVEFAARIEKLIESTLTEANIKSYFETMGEELSQQATAQWE